MSVEVADRKLIEQWLEEVKDPEVPVLSVMDLGIVRDIILDQGNLEIVITPTYSGCPAMDVISAQIRMAMAGRGFKTVKLTQVLNPAWTTDWMSEEGKGKAKGLWYCSTSAQTNRLPPRHVSTGRSHPMPALRILAYPASQRIRIHGLQGPVPVFGLPGTLRLFQMPLIH